MAFGSSRATHLRYPARKRGGIAFARPPFPRAPPASKNLHRSGRWRHYRTQVLTGFSLAKRPAIQAMAAGVASGAAKACPTPSSRSNYNALPLRQRVCAYDRESSISGRAGPRRAAGVEGGAQRRKHRQRANALRRAASPSRSTASSHWTNPTPSPSSAPPVGRWRKSLLPGPGRRLG